MSRNLNLREQFNADTKGHASFQEYCRAEVDRKPEVLTIGDYMRPGLIEEFKSKTGTK